MEKVDAVIDESFFLADYVALNLFMLDCRSLNKVIVTLLHEIKNFVTDYFKALNQKENRRYVNILPYNLYLHDRIFVDKINNARRAEVSRQKWNRIVFNLIRCLRTLLRTVKGVDFYSVVSFHFISVFAMNSKRCRCMPVNDRKKRLK